MLLVRSIVRRALYTVQRIDGNSFPGRETGTAYYCGPYFLSWSGRPIAHQWTIDIEAVQ